MYREEGNEGCNDMEGTKRIENRWRREKKGKLLIGTITQTCPCLQERVGSHPMQEWICDSLTLPLKTSLRKEESLV